MSPRGRARSESAWPSEPDPRKQEYVIGPSDVLRISVWHNADLTGDAIVRPDGTITLPLIGDLRAAGRTSEQIRVELTQRLGAFIKDESAIATIAVTGINSYRFTLLGNVEKPGTIVANHYVTVSEALSLGGGPNRFATPEEMVIVRTEGKRGRRRMPSAFPCPTAAPTATAPAARRAPAGRRTTCPSRTSRRRCPRRG